MKKNSGEEEYKNQNPRHLREKVSVLAKFHVTVVDKRKEVQKPVILPIIPQADPLANVTSFGDRLRGLSRVIPYISRLWMVVVYDY
jgi:hypothetical protein